MAYLSSFVPLGPNLMGRQAKFAGNNLLDSARSLSGQSMGHCRGTDVEFFGDAS
nr:hypothetical protein [Leptolyngbya sp. LK]